MKRCAVLLVLALWTCVSPPPSAMPCANTHDPDQCLDTLEAWDEPALCWSCEPVQPPHASNTHSI